MTWHSAKDGDGHWVHIWEEKGVRREGDTPGGFTRAIQSRLPVSKKKKWREKTSTAASKTRGKKGRTLSSPKRAPHFSLSLLWFFPLFLLPLCFAHILNLSHSLYFLFYFIIILSSSVTLRHVFQGLPSIDTVSTNSSLPVESPWGRWRAGGGPPGKAFWVPGDTGEVETRL